LLSSPFFFPFCWCCCKEGNNNYHRLLKVFCCKEGNGLLTLNLFFSWSFCCE
jgi:hypothetical protein